MPRCPHCGHPTEASECPLCGTTVGADDARTDPAAADAGAPTSVRGDRDGMVAAWVPDPGPESPAGVSGADGPREEVPWEDPSHPFPSDLWITWRESLLRPAAFFGRLAAGGRPASLARPVLYLLLAAALAAAFTLFWELALLDVAGGGNESAAARALWFFVSPFVALFSLLVSSLYFHLGVLILAPRRRGLRETARVVCYSWGPAVLAAIPFLGALAALVWPTVLQVVGLRVVHRTTTGRALVIVLWLPLLMVMLGVVLLLIVALMDPSVLLSPETGL